MKTLVGYNGTDMVFSQSLSASGVWVQGTGIEVQDAVNEAHRDSEYTSESYYIVDEINGITHILIPE